MFWSLLPLDTLAEELEMPFGFAKNHLPLDALCTTIEINLREMNLEQDLSDTPQPDSCYRLT
ncbi:bestrophin family ion channel [Erwinia piriflorinigrans]